MTILNTVNVDIVNLIASISSIILAIVSLTLSIFFYRWSDKSNKEIVKQATAIDSNTKKIEQLFDKLYYDTFNMMKSSHQAMQQKVFGNSTVISSSDSELNPDEVLEEFIKTVVVKSEKIEVKTLCYLVQTAHVDKKYGDEKINDILIKLDSSGIVTLKEGCVLKTVTPSKTAESGNSFGDKD